MQWNGKEWVAETPPTKKPASRVKRIGATAAQATLVTALTFGLIAGTTFAGKGGGRTGGGASVTMVPLDGWANQGDLVTFTVVTSNAYPVVSVTCKQGEAIVYGSSHPMYQPNIWDDPGIFGLVSLAWTSGAADCTATAKGTSSNGKVVTLGSTSFHVDP